VFYAGKLLLVPLAGFALPAVPLLARNRRAWFGLAMAGLFCLPLLFLPGRLFSAYCYVPFAGVALVASGFDLKSREARAAAALLFVLWAPWDYSQMRVQRRGKLARDDEVRAWMGALGEFGARGETIDAFVFAGAPAGFQRWGIEGAIKHFFPRPDLEIRRNEDPEAQAALHRSRVAMLTWDYRRKLLRIVARTPETAPFTYLKMDAETPVWQLGDGWFGLEDSYRWTKPQAMAELWRPAGARRFELRINIGPEEKQMAGRQQVTVTLGEASLDPRRIAGLAWQTLRWDLPPAPESRVQVKIEVSPGFRPRAEGRELGLAVGGFGFVAEGVE